jgi:hypothetical protein
MPREWLAVLLFATTLLCMSNFARAGEAEIREAVAMLSDEDKANDAEAAKTMLREAEAGALDAQAYLVYLYDDGIGVSRDPEAATRWETRLGAATGGDWFKAYAALLVVPKDSTTAAKDGTLSEWLQFIGRRIWATNRILKHGERKVLEASAEIDRLTRQPAKQP